MDTHGPPDDFIPYRVVSGDVIKPEAASISDMYESAELLEWIRSVTAIEHVGPFPAFQVERPPGLDDYLYSADQR